MGVYNQLWEGGGKQDKRKERRDDNEMEEIQINAKGRKSHARTSGRVGKDHAFGSGYSHKDAATTSTVQSHTGSA